MARFKTEIDNRLAPILAASVSAILLLMFVISIWGEQSESIAPASNEQSFRELQDLRAQQQMANWALGMLISSSLGLIVTALGVYYVRHTLDQTVAANEAALTSAEAALASVRASQADQRPWLDFNVENFGKFQFVGDYENISTVLFFPKVSVTNFGKSPALHVNYAAVPFIAPTFDSDVGYAELLKKLSRPIEGGWTVFPGRTERYEKWGAGHGVCKTNPETSHPNAIENLWIVFGVAYRSVFGEVFYTMDYYYCALADAVADPDDVHRELQSGPDGRRML